LFAAILLLAILPSLQGAEPAPPYPLWDGHETVADYARKVSLPTMKTLELGGGVKMEMVLIPAGKFIMGSPEPVPVDEDWFYEKMGVGAIFLAVGSGALLVFIGVVVIRAIRLSRRLQYSLARFMAMMFALSVAVLGGEHWWYSNKLLKKAKVEYQKALVNYKMNEGPAHEVTLTKPFYMGKFTVTQEQYQQVMGSNPSHFNSAKNPVETVSWDDAQEFCKKVNAASAQAVRLPSEAEWEYACRAGSSTKFYSGDTEADLERVAWFDANSGNTTHPVGLKVPNKFGLYDMHGNVCQWCQDWYRNYKADAVVDPQGLIQGFDRVLRGCSWRCRFEYCRAALRDPFFPDRGTEGIGFRVVVPVSKAP
jgi:formylglycine-generating enzyme required for sulfatase activity